MAPDKPHRHSGLDWTEAKSLMPMAQHGKSEPEGALIPDALEDSDHIAVVYNKGETPPEITIKAVSGTVHTVCANGVAVAVVARATGPAPTIGDVLLVERST